MKIKNILIVGGGGNLGSNFIDFLDSNYKIFVIDKNPIQLKKKNIKFIKYDFLKKKNNIAYFFIGKLGGPESIKIKKYALYFKYNCQTLINFLKLVDKKRIKKLVFTSTEHVYGDSDKTNLNTLNLEPSPKNYYGLTKLFSEKILFNFYNEKKISIDILRFPRVISENSDNFIQKIIKKIILKNKIIIENPDQRFNIIFNGDIMSALKRCSLINKNKFRILNIFNYDNPISLKSIISTIVKKVNVKSNIRYIHTKKKSHNPENLNIRDIYSKKNLNWKPKYNNTKIILSILKNNESK